MKRSTLSYKTILFSGALATMAGIAAGNVTGRFGTAHAGDESAAAVSYAIGDPLPGLDSETVALFAAGQALFNHQFTATEGLGPIYNERACSTCHGAGAVGGGDPVGPGATEFNVTHFGFDNQGFFDPMRDLGGLVIQHRTIRDTTNPDCPMLGESVPAVSNIQSRRNTPPVFGFGLLDAIPDSEILRRQGLGIDGVYGVANWGIELQARDATPVPGTPLSVWGPTRVGRFGWHAQTGTLFQFSTEPFNIELGITTPFFPQEFTPAGTRFAAQLPATCNVAQHAVNDFDSSMSVSLYHFQALLAPPPALPKNQDAKAGEALFNALGCELCHTSQMQTGDRYNLILADGTTKRVRQMENRIVHAYSDLLIHDMGLGLADDPSGATIGRVMGRADGRHWRTTPLWGIRFKKALLHDGRTDSIESAILAHGGEGNNARNRFAGLGQRQRDQIVAFLNTL